MKSSDPGVIAEPQRDVQRLLGRCMLRLQQYERLLKAILADRMLAGGIDSLESQRAERAEAVRSKSLGLLAKELFESYVVPDGFDEAGTSVKAASADQFSMSMRFSIAMEPDRWCQTKAAVEELVRTRNELVHHLIERFDVWTEEGCSAAARHLSDTYGRIDLHYAELARWAEGIDDVRKYVAVFLQSPEFRDVFVNGVAPDGRFEWHDTGIVRVLRESLKAVGADGWGRLDRARAWLAATYPEQTPEKYRCRTWPQVLHDSGQFDLEYRPGEDGRKLAWFRERPTRARGN